MSSLRTPVGDILTLAAADDLNGDPTNAATYLDVTGADRVIILQIDSGTAGTAGIDLMQISRDGGLNWSALPIEDDDGTAIATGLLNAAGVEPAGRVALFSAPGATGNFDGPCLIRVVRDAAVAAASAAWVTGAPRVAAVRIG